MGLFGGLLGSAPEMVQKMERPLPRAVRSGCQSAGDCNSYVPCPNGNSFNYSCAGGTPDGNGGYTEGSCIFEGC